MSTDIFFEFFYDTFLCAFFVFLILTMVAMMAMHVLDQPMSPAFKYSVFLL